MFRDETMLWAVCLTGALAIHTALLFSLDAGARAPSPSEIRTEILIEGGGLSGSVSIAKQEETATAIDSEQEFARPNDPDRLSGNEEFEAAAPARNTKSVAIRPRPERLALNTDRKSIAPMPETATRAKRADTAEAPVPAAGSEPAPRVENDDSLQPARHDETLAAATAEPLRNEVPGSPERLPRITEGPKAATAAPVNRTRPVATQPDQPPPVRQALRPQAAPLADTRPERNASTSPSEMAAAVSAEPERIRKARRQAPPREPVGPQSIATVAPERPEPVARRPAAGTSPAPPKPAKPVSPQIALNTIKPATRDRNVAPDAGERDYRLVLNFMKRYGTGSCLAVMPRVEADGQLRLEAFAQDRSEFVAFRDRLAREEHMAPKGNLLNVQQEQCRVLSFITTAGKYPDFRLRMKLDSDTIISGEMLKGSISAITGNRLYLLLIDDYGRVLDASALLKVRSGSVTIEGALSIDGDEVSTAQIAMAISVNEPLTTVDRLSGEAAGIFFSELTEELAARREQADIAIQGFTLQRRRN